MSAYLQTAAEAFRAALLGNTAAGQRVLTRLDRPLSPTAADLPAIIVYANQARRGSQDYGNSLIPRELVVNIEGAVVAMPETALDEAQALVDQIETLIEADPSLAGAVNACRWQRSIADVSSVGSATLGVCLLQYDVEMLTSVRQPEAFGIGDDGFDAPPRIVRTVPDHDTAPIGYPITPDPRFACGPDGCAPPAWGGEVKPNGEPL